MRLAAPESAAAAGAGAGAGAAVLASPPPARGPAGGTAVTVLRRQGDVWLIDLPGGGPLHINDGRGVRLLALLLARPGQEIHSLELVAAVDRSMPPGAASARARGSESRPRRGAQGGSGPALDAAAKRAYRARLAALDREIADAERRGDGALARKLGDERAAVANELDRAVGLGGRDREIGSDAERARVNVTRAIRAAIRRVASYDARLGAELGAGVRTGAYCVYTPDPRRPRRWRVEDGGGR
jgi:non-specific serine/threonine protein kinase